MVDAMEMSRVARKRKETKEFYNKSVVSLTAKKKKNDMN